MSRYVLLRHELPTISSRASHWDLMLEVDGALRTWAMEDLPSHGNPVLANSLPDHRLDYLQYEGSISGDRGRAWRWDAGHFDYLSNAADESVVKFDGLKLRATWTLSRAVDDHQRWVVLVSGF